MATRPPRLAASINELVANVGRLTRQARRRRIPYSRHPVIAFTDRGRCDAALLAGEEMAVGCYELVLAAGDYFTAQGTALPEPKFIDRETIVFGIAEAAQTDHVPLVVSPWAYSTNRGN